MSPEQIRDILDRYKNGDITVETALDDLRELPFKDLDGAHIDNHRHLRVGYPEVVLCSGKSDEHLEKIFRYLVSKDENILATRATKAQFDLVQGMHPGLVYHETARVISLTRTATKPRVNYITVVTAGTSDIPVAEEAAVTSEIFGNRVERIFDVGVAGVHRLFSRIDTIRKARVVIVVAGMEGALPSVIGGLIDKPIIAVPTSIGYGASFGGLSALLTMLNSCAAGVSVVNIDNGFGAGYIASMINTLE
jgi:NCAIR mutase (PurE)-related protein